MDSLKPALGHLAKIALLSLCCLLLFACQSEIKKRPFGYMRLGEVSGFLVPEKYLPDLRLLIKRDDRGLYAMSTECTHDLSALRLVERNGEKIFISDYSTSTYDWNGKVLSGPAKANLPYYSLRVDSGVYGGPKDTLYVDIGDERPPSWRLPID